MEKQTWNVTINMTVEIIEPEKPTKVKTEPTTSPSNQRMPILYKDNEDKFYTCQQVAEMLNVNKQLIWKWIRDGKLVAVNFGR